MRKYQSGLNPDENNLPNQYFPEHILRGLGDLKEHEIARRFPVRHVDTVIGFTATDKYSDKKSLLRTLKHQIHRMPITEAVNLGLITPFSIMTAETQVDLSAVRTDCSRGDYNQEDLGKALNDPRLSADVIRRIGNTLRHERDQLDTLFAQIESDLKLPSDLSAQDLLRKRGKTCPVVSLSK